MKLYLRQKYSQLQRLINLAMSHANPTTITKFHVNRRAIIDFFFTVIAPRGQASAQGLQVLIGNIQKQRSDLWQNVLEKAFDFDFPFIQPPLNNFAETAANFQKQFWSGS